MGESDVKAASCWMLVGDEGIDDNIEKTRFRV